MFRNAHFDPSPRTRLASSGPSGASSAVPGGAAELAQSAEILSRLAASRPGGFLSASDLMEMAANPHDDYASTVQKAARNFLANGRNIHVAFEQNRRRNAHSRGSGGSARRFSYGDLQELCTGLMGDPDRLAANFARQAEQAAADVYEQALHGVAGYMRRRQRDSISADGLVYMDRQGFGPAGVLLGDMSRTGGLLERAFEAELRLIFSRVEDMLADPQWATAADRQAAPPGRVPRQDGASLIEIEDDDVEERDENDDDENGEEEDQLQEDANSGSRQRNQQRLDDDARNENIRRHRLRQEYNLREADARKAQRMQDDLNAQRRQEEVLVKERQEAELLRKLIEEDEVRKAAQRARPDQPD